MGDRICPWPECGHKESEHTDFHLIEVTNDIATAYCNTCFLPCNERQWGPIPEPIDPGTMARWERVGKTIGYKPEGIPRWESYCHFMTQKPGGWR